MNRKVSKECNVNELNMGGKWATNELNVRKESLNERIKSYPDIN